MSIAQCHTLCSTLSTICTIHTKENCHRNWHNKQQFKKIFRVAIFACTKNRFVANLTVRLAFYTRKTSWIVSNSMNVFLSAKREMNRFSPFFFLQITIFLNLNVHFVNCVPLHKIFEKIKIKNFCLLFLQLVVKYFTSELLKISKEFGRQ